MFPLAKESSEDNLTKDDIQFIRRLAKKVHDSGIEILKIIEESLSDSNVEVSGEKISEIGRKMEISLRTPINTVIGYSEMLQEDADDIELDTLHEDLEKITGDENRKIVQFALLSFEKDKIYEVEIIEYLYFDDETWVARRQALIEWVAANHPELDGFIYDQTKAGALNYLKAIELYKAANNQ